MLKVSAQNLFLACLAFAFTRCGFRFGPGFSMNDSGYFAEQPHIVVRNSQYSLRWKYGSWGFYFNPGSKVSDGQLLFSLQATSSSGNLTGRYQEVPITGKDRISAIETRGAFWLEPDGTKVRLEVKRL